MKKKVIPEGRSERQKGMNKEFGKHVDKYR